MLGSPSGLYFCKVHFWCIHVKESVKFLLNRLTASSKFMRQVKINSLVIFYIIIIQDFLLKLFVVNQFLHIVFRKFYYFFLVFFKWFLGKSIIKIVIHLLVFFQPWFFKPRIFKRVVKDVRNIVNIFIFLIWNHYTHILYLFNVVIAFRIIIKILILLLFKKYSLLVNLCFSLTLSILF